MSSETTCPEIAGLSFTFRGRQVPVTYPSTLSREQAQQAILSEPFQVWYKRCERTVDDKRIEIHRVEIQSVDFFGARGVGFCKIRSQCTLVDGLVEHEYNLPGICFLRGNAVCIFVALFCEDGSTYSLLVQQPRVPIGQVSCLELPAGMVDDDNESVTGIAVKEMEEECGIKVKPSELVDLTEMACQQAFQNGYIPMPGIAPSPGGCDEFCRFMYLEKKVTIAELHAMKDRLSGLREHGEYITLTVVPMDDVWKVSADMKAMVSLFLLEQLRKEGKLPPAGQLATPIADLEPSLTLNTGKKIPQLAFGLYKVPADQEGENAVLEAIRAGYRHFDGASFYSNEIAVGRAFRRSGLPREDLFIVGKVWKDAVRQGRTGVRNSVKQSLADLDFGEYFDLYFIHWPVPGLFVDAYKELEVLYNEGIVRAIGISNFNEEEYHQLVSSGIRVQPSVNQVEISPVMYRPRLVDFFQEKGILVAAYKPLNRGAAFEKDEIVALSRKHKATPAQIMLRWAFQKGLIVVTKTVRRERMNENRSIFHFHLTESDMELLDSLTSEDDILTREKDEMMKKKSL